MKTSFGFLLLLYFSIVICAAQSPTQMADSLKKDLQKHPEQDSLRVNRLLEFADVLNYTNPDEAMQYTNEALQLAEKLHLYAGQAAAQRQKTVIYMHKGDYLNAIETSHQALALSDKLFERLDDDKAKKMFEATVYNNLGAIYLEIEQLDKAIDNFSKLVTIAHQLEEPREEAVGLGNLGEAYVRKENYEKAIAYFDKAIDIAQKNNDYLVLAFALSNKGVALNSLKKYAAAIPVFQSSIQNADKVGDIRFKTISMEGLAESYFNLNQYTQAAKYAHPAYESAKSNGLLQQQRDSAKLLSMVYEKTNKPEQSLLYLKESITLTDSLISVEKQVELTRRDMKFEQEKREALLNAEIKQKQIERNAVLGIGAILLVAVGVSAFFYKRKRDADLSAFMASEKQKEAEYQSLISDTENKTLRTQMNPHFISNAFTSIQNFITKNDAEIAGEYLAKFAKLMRLVLENSEEKDVLLEKDIEALQLYMELESLRFKDQFDYEINIDGNIIPDETLIPPLLLQPFVENSILHGLHSKQGKGMIKVEIRKEGDMMRCSVEDNGIGRKKAAALRSPIQLHKSMGIELTKKRIAIYTNTHPSDDTVSYIDSDEGTKVEVKLPLQLTF